MAEIKHIYAVIISLSCVTASLIRALNVMEREPATII